MGLSGFECGKDAVELTLVGGVEEESHGSGEGLVVEAESGEDGEPPVEGSSVLDFLGDAERGGTSCEGSGGEGIQAREPAFEDREEGPFDGGDIEGVGGGGATRGVFEEEAVEEAFDLIGGLIEDGGDGEGFHELTAEVAEGFGGVVVHGIAEVVGGGAGVDDGEASEVVGLGFWGGEDFANSLFCGEGELGEEAIEGLVGGFGGLWEGEGLEEDVEEGMGSCAGTGDDAEGSEEETPSGAPEGERGVISTSFEGAEDFPPSAGSLLSGPQPIAESPTVPREQAWKWLGLLGLGLGALGLMVWRRRKR